MYHVREMSVSTRGRGLYPLTSEVQGVFLYEHRTAAHRRQVTVSILGG